MNILDELVAPDIIDHTNQQQGWEKFKNLFTNTFVDFSDWYETIEDFICEGEKVWIHVKATGTYSGNWTLRKIISCHRK